MSRGNDMVWDDNGAGQAARDNTDRWVIVGERLTRLEVGQKAIDGKIDRLGEALERLEAREVGNGRAIDGLGRRVGVQGWVGLGLIGVLAGLTAGWEAAGKAVSFLVKLW